MDVSKTSQFRESLIASHIGSPYYTQAEHPEWVAIFWGQNSIFLDMFSQLDLENIIELACGWGRHAAQIINRACHVTLVDANKTNIDACRQRFCERTNVSYLVNSGRDLADLRSASYSALFSYDAVVHFEPLDVVSYIHETARILRPGGRALLHYSNCDDNFGTYTDNPNWRNFFSEKMMRAFSYRAGLSVLRSAVIPWGNRPDSDALTLLEKPNS